MTPPSLLLGIAAIPAVCWPATARVSMRLDALLEGGDARALFRGGYDAPRLRDLPYFLMTGGAVACLAVVTEKTAAQLICVDIFLSLLAIAALIDRDEAILPNFVLAPLFLLAVGIQLLGVGMIDWPWAIFGAAVGLVMGSGIRAILSRGKRRQVDQDVETLGWGDIKMFVVIGAWVGPVWLYEVITTAFFTVAGITLISRWIGIGSDCSMVPFGPYILFSSCAVTAIGGLP